VSTAGAPARERLGAPEKAAALGVLAFAMLIVSLEQYTPASLAALLGQQRARMLRWLERPATPGELADKLHGAPSLVTPSSARAGSGRSHHPPAATCASRAPTGATSSSLCTTATDLSPGARCGDRASTRPAGRP
jgi:hypothetical protein